MKRKKFAPCSVGVNIVTDAYDYWYLIPTISVCKKYWYLWYLDFTFLKWSIRFEFCRKDWNAYEEESGEE